MDIQSLKTFCAVVSEGSMTAASAKLAITQPAVSQQVRHLEKIFQVKLLTRRARKFRPTIQGQILFENSNRILSLLQQTTSSIQAISLNLSGEKINVSTLNSIGLYLVSPVIGNLLKLNSKMKLSLFYGAGEEVIRRMQKGSVDVVIMPDLKKEYGKEFPQFKKLFLFKEAMYFVGSGRDMSLPKSLPFRDIGKFRLTQMEGHYPSFQNLFMKKLKDSGVNLEPSFQCNNVGTVKRVIESGLGLGFVPAHSVKKQLRLERLKAIQIEGFSYSIDVNLYYKGGNQKEKIIRTLALLIQQQIPGSVF